MLLDTPEWGSRHNFHWHSNPKSKPVAKTLFDKVHLRPKIEAMYDIVKSKNDPRLPEAWETIKALDSKYNMSGSAAMTGGILAQAGADAILLKNKEPADAIAEQVEAFKKYKPRDWDGGKDVEKHKKYIDELPGVIEHSVLGLREAMARDNRIIGEVEFIEHLPGLALPHNTRPDYNRRGDLKTKWSPQNKKSKSGWSKASMPSSLTGMFDIKNVYQAAGFWALNGGQPPFIIYASCTDYKIFTSENAIELTDGYLAEVVEHICLMHKSMENMLRSADTKEQLLSLVAPDYTEIYWEEPPGIIAEAKKLWRF